MMSPNLLEWHIPGNSKPVKIYFDSHWETLLDHLKDRHSVFVVDSKVLKLYPDKFSSQNCILIESSEQNKSLQSVDSIVSQLIQFNADRESVLIAVGGGIVCDITAFVASVYMRSCDLVLIPTTLLSMVDASVGGKTAVNHHSWKNLIGTFYQPSFIFIMTDFLKTLPSKEFNAGMAEVIKHAHLGNSKMMQLIKDHATDLKDQKKEYLLQMIRESIAFKISIVEKDEKENGLRRILNFGHTFGHAIEKEGFYNHGESIAIGMMIALKMSEMHTNINPSISEDLKDLLMQFDLPVSSPIGISDLMNNIKIDKKKSGDSVHFVFLEDIGKAKTEKLSFDQIHLYLSKIL